MSDSATPWIAARRPPCPSQTPRVYSNSCPSSWWYHPAISSSVIPFSSSCPQSLPASGSFPMSQLFTWGGQSIGVSTSASVLPMNTQDWSPLGWTDTYRVHYKELDYTVMEVGKSKICKVYQWSKRPTESYVSVWRLSGRKSQSHRWSLKAISWKILFTLREGLSFSSIQTFNWLDEVHLHSRGQPAYCTIKMLI